jgi:hypothetical protein
MSAHVTADLDAALDLVVEAGAKLAESVWPAAACRICRAARSCRYCLERVRACDDWILAVGELHTARATTTTEVDQ